MIYEVTEPDYFDIAGLLARTRPTWMDKGACRDYPQSWWFPSRTGVDDSRKAKMICSTCPVRTECLDYALANGEYHGIWGGSSERQRQRMRRG